MKLSVIPAVLLFLGCFSSGACWISGQKTKYPDPPPGSYGIVKCAVSERGVSETVPGAGVKVNFFSTIKAQPFVGRIFLTDEYQNGGSPVVVLSHQYWRERFNSDPSLIGKTLEVNDRTLTVVGVMPPDFEIPPGAKLWMPIP
jgi:hypothetical protein